MATLSTLILMCASSRAPTKITAISSTATMITGTTTMTTEITMGNLTRRSPLPSAPAGAAAPAFRAQAPRTLAGTPADADERLFGSEAITATGPHQAGITTVPVAHVRYLAFMLRPETDRDALVRLFRI